LGGPNEAGSVILNILKMRMMISSKKALPLVTKRGILLSIITKRDLPGGRMSYRISRTEGTVAIIIETDQEKMGR
jgi:hypothetical protein